MPASSADDLPLLCRFMQRLQNEPAELAYDGAAHINRLADGRPAARILALKTVAIHAED